MKLQPELRFAPRVARDVDRCIRFVARQPSGRPREREQEIYAAIDRLWRNPFISAVRAHKGKPGLAYRRYNAGKFVIIYAYVAPNPLHLRGMVSIRAVRHVSEKDVFWGVKDSSAQPRSPALHHLMT